GGRAPNTPASATTGWLRWWPTATRRPCRWPRPGTPPPDAGLASALRLRFGCGRGRFERWRIGHVDGDAACVLRARADADPDAAAAEAAAADPAAAGTHAHRAAAVSVGGALEQHAVGAELGRLL